MPTSPFVASTDTPLTDDGAAIDQFIRSNTPAWLRAASSAQLQRLQACLKVHHEHQGHVVALLERIEPMDVFLLFLFNERLSEWTSTRLDANTARWREIRLRFGYSPFRINDADMPVAEFYPDDSSLFSRFLRNFTQAHTEASFYYPGSGVMQGAERLPIAPEQLATVCRRLDPGQRYQDHLDTVLGSEGDAVRRQVIEWLAQDQRSALAAHACCSQLKGHIDEAALERVLALAGGPSLSPGQPGGHYRPLELLGFPLLDARVFELKPPTQLGGWLLYLPNDSLKPLRQYASLEALAYELGQNLKAGDYLKAFLRRLRADDRPGFLARLAPLLAADQSGLPIRVLPALPLDFYRFSREQVARIKADAASMAVPTRKVDEKLHQQRVAALESLGTTVAGALAWFVPGLAEVMLARLVKDVLSEVCEGVEDWSHGQRGEAVDHFLGVVQNLATGAAVSAGTAVAVRIARSAFVDRLLPVSRNDGRQRLWHRDLSAYRSPRRAVEVQSDGLIHGQGRTWWPRGGEVYEVREDPATHRWQLVHPSRADAYAPEIRGNGEGAWRVATEHPLYWQGVPGMLRRMGPRVAGLSDAACEQAALVAGVDEPMLRGLLTQHRAMPALLVEVLERFALDARIDRFFTGLDVAHTLDGLDETLCSALRQLSDGRADAPEGLLQRWKDRAAELRVALFAHLSAAAEPGLPPAGQAIQRAFPGLSGGQVLAVLEQSTEAQRVTLERQQRVPLAVLERARHALHGLRISRALESVCLRNSVTVDGVKLIFALLRQLPAWPAGLSYELREGSVGGRVLERLLPVSDTLDLRLLILDQGQFEVFDAHGDALHLPTAPAGVFDALIAGLPAAGRVALDLEGPAAAEALRARLFERASAARKQMASLLGITGRPLFFRAVQRLERDRVGYPMGGRGHVGRRSLGSIVQTLFPGFNDLETGVFIEQLQQSHRDPMGELMRFQQSLRSLELTLARWERQASAVGRIGRRRVVDEIRRCWCRQTPPVLGHDGRLLGYRLRLDHIAVGDLPELPRDVDFSHVVDLSISEAGQTQQINGFLQRFTELRWLDISHNLCTDLPLALRAMPHLQELVLGGNRIRLTETGGQTLSSMSRLEVLYLDGNPLDATPDLSQLHRLRRLSLRHTNLPALPEELLSRPFLEMADLRGNQLMRLPEHFFTASMHLRDVMLLHGNPLPQELRIRLSELVQWDRLPVSAQAADDHRVDWLRGLEGEQRAACAEHWDSLLAEEGSAPLFRILGDLLDTAEYRHNAAALRPRVWSMLEAAVEHSQFRTSLFELADGPVSCVDSIASAFSALEVHFQVFMIGARGGERRGASLLRFARRLFRLERLEGLINEVVAARQARGEGVDEIEISLAYRIGLARELDLPGQPAHMEYADVARVSPADLQVAATAVRAAETSEALPSFLAARDFWIAYLRERHPQSFVAIEEQFWERLDPLEEARSGLQDAEYMGRMNQLSAERDAALQANALQLTGQILREGSGASEEGAGSSDF